MGAIVAETARYGCPCYTPPGRSACIPREVLTVGRGEPMAAATSKKKTKTAARPAPHKKVEARPAAKEKDKAAARPVAKVAVAPARPTPPAAAPAGKGVPAAKPVPGAKAGAMPPRPLLPTARPGAPGKPGDRPRPKKGGRKSPLSQRRGPNGELVHARRPAAAHGPAGAGRDPVPPARRRSRRARGGHRRPSPRSSPRRARRTRKAIAAS